MRAWWFVRRPHTQGVKCILRDEAGCVLFVRHTYGDRTAWELPGGGMRRREDPGAAVRREMREELGIALADVRAVGEVETAGNHKRTLLHCFEATTGGAALVLAAAEIGEARWAPAGAPPTPLGRDAAAILARARG
jgi:8-oxo-dGTP pyrophosphatase MutT (NUDIX family)